MSIKTSHSPPADTDPDRRIWEIQRKRGLRTLRKLGRAVAPPRTPADNASHRATSAAKLVRKFESLGASAVANLDAAAGDEIDVEKERLALEYIGVPARFQGINLRQLEPWLPDRMRSEAARLVWLLDEPGIVALIGPVGRGKSALAAALVEFFWRAKRRAYRRRVYELLTSIGEAPFEPRPGVEGKEQIRRRYFDADLLVLDELDRRDLARVGLECEFETLIDHRYEHNLATVLISNLQPSALQENLGQKVARRIKETGGLIVADWERVEELRPGGSQQ